MLAVEGGYDATVDTLLHEGAETNLKDNDGRTALYYLPGENFEFIASRLTAHGASTTVKDEDGLTPIEYYRKNGDSVVVKYLTNPYKE